MGKLAGENSYKYAIYASNKVADNTQLEKSKEKIKEIFDRENSINFYKNKDKLGEIFYNQVGIIRDNINLEEALDEIIKIQIHLVFMGLGDKNIENNTNLIELLEFENMLLLAPTIVSSALARDESRGSHFKLGFEDRDDGFKKHIVLGWSGWVIDNSLL